MRYNQFFEEKLGKYLNTVSSLSPGEKPKVYLEADFGGGQTYYTCGFGHAHNAFLVAAGGCNIFSELQGFKQVDPESVALEALVDVMLARTELNQTVAVKNKKAYMITWDCTKGGGRFYLGMGYLGKWLQPEIFQDYSPREAYQEYLDEFQGAKVDVINKGVFFYPEA
jgi:iron complex transport system substrate-binding protein